MTISLTKRTHIYARGGRGRSIAFLLALVIVLMMTSMPTPAAVDRVERIFRFDSEIWVHRDGSMTVRETIEVNAARREIRRGIYRDFPTVRLDRFGKRFDVGFDIEEITRDGKPEPYHTQRRDNGVRIYIGNKDVVLAPGRYVYTITYRTNRQLHFADDFDELYWNVTGNDWDFPIEHTRATIHLPEGAPLKDSAGYTGPKGAKGNDFTYTPLSDGVVRFETTRPLKPGEGLTVAASWPVGFIDRPTSAQLFRYSLSDKAQQLLYFLRHNSVLAAGVIGVGLLLLYYVYVWHKVGRDPERGVIVPQYEPPGGLSPAGARYVSRFGFDDKTFTAAIVNMAVKGYLTIRENDDKTFTLVPTGKNAPLTPGEKAIGRELFLPGWRDLLLGQANHVPLQAAQRALAAKLRSEFDKTHFVHNTRYFIPGVVLSVLLLGMIALTGKKLEDAAGVAAFLGVGSFFVYFLAFVSWKNRRAIFTRDDPYGTQEGIWIAVAALGVSGFVIFILFFGFPGVTLNAAAKLVPVIVGVNLLFYVLLKAPTRLGRRLMDQLEGFKQYLSVAEKDRMNMLNPPEKTPQVFEKYLPYALALDVEQEWAEQFSGVLAAASTAPGSGTHDDGDDYRPDWYSGHALDGGLSSFGSALGGAFSAAISFASTSPDSGGGSSDSSSSASSGGGSSGGGGGGGGGGGW